MHSFAVHALLFSFVASLLQVHAVLPPNGMYMIRSSGGNPPVYFNLENGSPAEGTPITVISPPGPFARWHFTRKSDGLFTLRNTVSDTYVDTPDEIVDGRVVGSKNAGIFKIREFDSVYRLDTTDEKYSLINPTRANGTRVVLADNSVGFQTWAFEKV